MKEIKRVLGEDLERNADGDVRPTLNNLIKVFKDTLGPDGIRYDDWQQEIALPINERELTWSLYSVAPFRLGTMWDAAKLIASEHHFDSLMEYLEGLQWNGEDRLGRALVHHLGAADIPNVHNATKAWFAGTVRRAYRLGSPMERTLNLDDMEAIIFVRDLFPDEFWRGIPEKGLKTQATQKLLGSKWIVMLFQASAKLKSQKQAVSDFVTSPPYTLGTQNPVVHNRRCGIIATDTKSCGHPFSQKDDCFWSVDTQGYYRNTLTDELRDQIWAEAVVLYKQEEGLTENQPQAARSPA